MKKKKAKKTKLTVEEKVNLKLKTTCEALQAMTSKPSRDARRREEKMLGEGSDYYYAHKHQR